MTRQCPDCGGTDTIAVWKDPDRWVPGEPPDNIHCHNCNVIEE